MVKLTRHAIRRARERVGLRRRSVQRIADIAHKKGIKHSETNGNLKKYIDGLFLSNRSAGDIRVHGHNVYLFTKSGILITVLNLPNNLQDDALKIKQDRERATI